MKKHIITTIILVAVWGIPSISVLGVPTESVSMEDADNDPHDKNFYLNAKEFQMRKISFHAGGGLSTLSCQLPDGLKSGGFGGDFGLSYTHLWTNDYLNYWGIHTGLGVSIYRAKAQLDGMRTVQMGLVDDENHVFDLYTTISNYKEIQQLVYLNIPVMAQYRINRFYAMAGLKFGIPIGGRHKSDGATLTNEAYYPEMDVWKRTLTFRGYGQFEGRSSNEKLNLGLAVMLSAETGVRVSLNDNFSLHIGAYFDYGLNNLTPKDKTPFVNYDLNKPTEFFTRSVLSSYNDNSNSSTFTDKINLMAVGLKLRLSFDWK